MRDKVKAIETLSHVHRTRTKVDLKTATLSMLVMLVRSWEVRHESLASRIVSCM